MQTILPIFYTKHTFAENVAAVVKYPGGYSRLEFSSDIPTLADVALTGNGRGLSQYTMDDEGQLSYADGPTEEDYSLMTTATSWRVGPQLTPEQAIDMADQATYDLITKLGFSHAVEVSLG